MTNSRSGFVSQLECTTTILSQSSNIHSTSTETIKILRIASSLFSHSRESALATGTTGHGIFGGVCDPFCYVLTVLTSQIINEVIGEVLEVIANLYTEVLSPVRGVVRAFLTDTVLDGV